MTVIMAILGSVLLTGFHVFRFGKWFRKARALKQQDKRFNMMKMFFSDLWGGAMTSVTINSLCTIFLLKEVLTGDGSFSTFYLQLFLHLPIPVPFLASSFMQVFRGVSKEEKKVQLSYLLSKSEILRWQSVVREQRYKPHYFRFGSLDNCQWTDVENEEYLPDLISGKALLERYVEVREHVEEGKALGVESERYNQELKTMNQELNRLWESLEYAIGDKTPALKLEQLRQEWYANKQEEVLTTLTPRTLSASQEQLLLLMDDSSTTPEMKDMATQVFDAISEKRRHAKALSKRDVEYATIQTAMSVEGIQLSELLSDEKK